MTAVLISLLTAVFTFIGGFFAIRFRDKLHLVLGFSAGALLGVAFFDLLPEALELTKNTFPVTVVTGLVATGFCVYLVLDRMNSLHVHDVEHHLVTVNRRGEMGAAALAVHSFLDGVAIGLAFKVGAGVGAIVATAVLVHDFSDGINTVSIVLKNSGNKDKAFHWLGIDAVAPIIGAISTLFITLNENITGLLLALFCGFFLYIGACDLLPESYHEHSKRMTTLMTIVGIVVLFVAIRIAGL